MTAPSGPTAIAVVRRGDGITVTVVRDGEPGEHLPWLRGTSAAYADDDTVLAYLGWTRTSEWRPTEHQAGDREADVERSAPPPSSPAA